MTDFTTWERSTLESLAAKLTAKMIEQTAEIKRLKEELAQAYTPAKRGKPMPKTEHGDFSKQYWWNETDAEVVG